MNTRAIFKRSSTTYYYASIFFPPEIRDEVFTLYAFVRTADNFVDAVPQDAAGFRAFRKRTDLCLNGTPSGNTIIDGFCALALRCQIERTWIDAFLNAMESDTYKHDYTTYTELEEYMYGSAEVIGLMMAKLMQLPEESYTTARLQGKAMQLINFIRDIREDIDLGRRYLPEEDLERFGVAHLPPNTSGEQERFVKLIQFQLERYRGIQEQAESGYRFLPRRYRIPITTAAHMYNWTAERIRKNPLEVFQHKIKPSPARVMLNVARNFIFS
ncbi:MAG: phytoene/squalene synthase family protein [Patescibacteria group bacterium]|nr:phytoene/squalene synthase family protein [Patescibacteria group bacterium]